VPKDANGTTVASALIGLGHKASELESARASFKRVNSVSAESFFWKEKTL
jgi:hypothetical protein